MSSGEGLGVRGWGAGIPLAEQGEAWAEWDAQEEAADRAVEPCCYCFDTGEWTPDRCEIAEHRAEAS